MSTLRVNKLTGLDGNGVVIHHKIEIITGSAALEVNGKIKVVDATTGNLVLSLLASNAPDAGSVRIQRSRSDTSSNTVTIATIGGDTVGKEAELTLLPGEGYELIPDGVSDYLQF